MKAAYTSKNAGKTEEVQTEKKEEKSVKKESFKRVAIEESSEEEEAETAADETAASDSSSFIDKKDSNYNQFTIKKSVDQKPEAKTGVYATVFFDISIAKKPAGRLIMDLFKETPKTSENFLALCKGDRGNG